MVMRPLPTRLEVRVPVRSAKVCPLSVGIFFLSVKPSYFDSIAPPVRFSRHSNDPPLHLTFDLVTSPPLDSILARLVLPVLLYLEFDCAILPNVCYRSTDPFIHLDRIKDTTAVLLTIQPHYVSIDRYRYLCALVLSPHDACSFLEATLLPVPASYIDCYLHHFLHLVFQAILRLLRTNTAMSSNPSTTSSPVEIPAPRGYQAISNPTPIDDDGIRYYPERGDWSPLFVPNAETPRAADIPVDPMSGPDPDPAGMAAVVVKNVKIQKITPYGSRTGLYG
ncbi:hypothetical protein PGTUg99_005249 [Puccinia graminis f. sp. tritici]|uniref:Uncharacterized protein n=1 Tax=Puccinia graminis f. sp. tritici TaxID=56615 RepID=A0A5B0RXD7_PUCGR|nr:hypothetical protein PGTUg99_005249 [Puccinia graminis f. sp. tritici]